MSAAQDALNKLRTTREYILSVGEEFAIGARKGWFKPGPGGNPDHARLWKEWAQQVEVPFGLYYNQTNEDGINALNAGDVQATCSLYMNRARGYHDALEKIAKAGNGSLTLPVAPEDKPPPSILQPVADAAGDIAKGLFALAVVGGIILVTRK
jgi:hypothetical protein